MGLWKNPTDLHHQKSKTLFRQVFPFTDTHLYSSVSYTQSNFLFFVIRSSLRFVHRPDYLSMVLYHTSHLNKKESHTSCIQWSNCQTEVKSELAGPNLHSLIFRCRCDASCPRSKRSIYQREAGAFIIVIVYFVSSLCILLDLTRSRNLRFAASQGKFSTGRL